MAYSFAQLEAFAIQGGFPADLAPTMAAIAMAESSGNNVTQQGQPYATTGWGLWQITPGNSVPQFGVDQAMLNPVNNAKAAFAKWMGAGGNTAALRSQWTTYSSGAYLKFLPANAPAPANDGSVGAVGGGGSGTAEPSGFLADATGLTALQHGFEHIFDVGANNVAYAGIVGIGLMMGGVGIILLVKEASSVGDAVQKAASLAGGVGKKTVGRIAKKKAVAA